MECPRCRSTLDRYVLQGREAVACESCGYIGVPVEHRGDLAAFESWDDAIERFQQSNQVDAGTVETTEADLTPVSDAMNGSRTDDESDASPLEIRVEGTPTDGVGGDGDGGVACTVCGKAFEEQAQLNGHLAVHSNDAEDD